MNRPDRFETVFGAHQPLAAFASYVLSLPARFADTLFAWQGRIDERHRLMTMDERALRDVGLSRADVQKESEKPFWTL